MRNHLTDLREKSFKNYPPKVISALPGELVELDYVVAHRHKSIASRMVVMPLSPGPMRQLSPGEGCQVSKRIERKFWISTLQTVTTALSLFFYFYPHTFRKDSHKRVDSALIRIKVTPLNCSINDI